MPLPPKTFEENKYLKEAGGPNSNKIINII
jgi:hypothetical protein